MLPFPRLSPPRLLRVLAILGLAAGLGVWGAILLAPRPDAPPPALHAGAVRAVDTTPAALLFGKDGTLKTQVTVTGMIADATDGAVILSVDGGPPHAWRAGQEIAPGLRVARIGNNAVVLDQNGATTTLAAPPLPAAPAGIVNAAR
ncbi:general secretion pathway protein GspC [Bordetella genomosp. 10]|uniref:General secretion pathway protein GspC n=1 Tax=Bordetella genomosp. 10 TaxID=1416804 RepID=A0A261S916_9BORD|nr:general secretion pathway protein GspC [Bordetella genomosp. 10]OZI33836.1 general secretion pathway protein GspC [Bordetella genomosp. 10]